MAEPKQDVKNTKKKELTSDRRQYKLMQVVSKVDVAKDKYDWSSSESDSEDEDNTEQKGPGVLVVKSTYGKTRPLTETGKFSDRPAPVSKPPPNVTSEVDSQAQVDIKNAQMPYVYASTKSAVVLTRGQYLDLAEAKEKKKKREEKRQQAADEEKEILQRWMCDPRITADWGVFYSKEYKKCYFVNSKTNETTWKPPPLVLAPKPKTPPHQRKMGASTASSASHHMGNDVNVQPKWIRNLKGGIASVAKTVDKTLPTPPRFIKRWRRKARFAAAAIGFGACCGPSSIVLEGSCASEVMEIVDALGLTQQDLHALREAFREADWDNSGAMSAEELFAWLKEPLTKYSESIFKLADMDDSGLVDFTEFVKIVCFYCSFLEDDVLKFGFDLFDDDHSGTIDEYELSTLVEQMNGISGEGDAPEAGNIAEALKVIDQNGDGILDFPEFCQLCKRLPLVIFPAYKLQRSLMRKTLGEGRWSFILWNIDRESRVAEYMRSHHGRRPAGNFKSIVRIFLETFFGCVWPKLPRTHPDYIDGIRPAAGDRPVGTYGGTSEKRPDVDTSEFAPGSYS